MEVLGLPNGTCDKEGHGAKLSVNGEPHCIKCQAEAQRATRTHIPVVTAADPGEDAFEPNGMLRPGHKAADAPAVTVVPVGQPAPVAKAVIVPTNLESIKNAISRLPIPRTLTQYKRLKKIQALIDEAMSEDENAPN